MATKQDRLSEFTVSEHKVSVGTEEGKSHSSRGGLAGGLIWALILFIFLVLIIFVIMVGWNPRFLRSKYRKGDRGSSDDSKDKCVDYSKAFLWAIVISIVLIIVFWVLAGITAGFAKSFKSRC